MNKICIVIYFLFYLLSFGYEGKNFDKLRSNIFPHEINISGMTVENFLIFLSQESKVTLVASDEIKNNEVYLYIDKNKNFLDILDIFCSSKEYVIKDKNNHILISKRDEQKENRGILLGKVLSSDYNESLQGVKITLLDEYSKPCYTTKDGNFKIDNIPYGVYFIRGEKEGYEVVGEIIEINKKQNTVKLFLEKIYKIKNLEEKNSEEFVVKKIKIGDLENIKIENILPEYLMEQVKFLRDNKKDILYISGEEKKVEKVKTILENICHSNKEIRISIQILDITDNLFQELGFNWIYDKNSLDSPVKNGLVGGILNNSYTQGVGSIFTSTFNYITNFGSDDAYLNFGLNLLKSNQDLKISSTPSIVTTNGKEGSLKIITERIVGQERVENTENSQNTYLPIFREAGIVFKVLPEIIDENYISLKLDMESSDFKIFNERESNTEGSKENYGSKVSRNISTSLRLKNGETVFIGGLKKGIIQNQESKVPVIGELPMIGFLFKNSKKSKEITDLYIRLKVDVVENGSFKDFGIKDFESID